MALRGDLASSLRSAVRYPRLRRTPRRPGWGYCVGIRIDLSNPSRMLGGSLGAQMNAHARHSFLAIIVALILLVLASVSARAQDFSSSTGVQLYKRFCSSCHGDQGHGDGTVAKSFKIEVPDLTRIAHRHGGVFPAEQIRKIIDGRKTLPPHGSREMPVWGFEFYRENQDAGHPDPSREHES